MRLYRPSAWPGQCRYCMRRREVYSIGRSGGGTYRRGGRHYDSKMCAECALNLLPGAGVYGGATTHQFSVSGVEDIVGSLGTEEAAEILTAFRERKDRARWARNSTA